MGFATFFLLPQPPLLFEEGSWATAHDAPGLPVAVLLLISLHDFRQRVIESIFAEQLKQLEPASFPNVFQDLRYHEAYTLFP